MITPPTNRETRDLAAFIRSLPAATLKKLSIADAKAHRDMVK